MPATYGSGTASPSWDPRSVPYKLWADTVPPATVVEKSFGSVADIVIVTAIDVVSDGGGVGGFATWQEIASGVSFWSINVGANVDTFEWRGFLAIPFQELVGIRVSNDADTTIEFYMSGLLCAGPQGLPI